MGKTLILRLKKYRTKLKDHNRKKSSSISGSMNSKQTLQAGQSK